MDHTASGGVVAVNECVDCAVTFGPDESCSDDRCAECAAARGYLVDEDKAVGELAQPSAYDGITALAREPLNPGSTSDQTSEHATGGRL